MELTEDHIRAISRRAKDHVVEGIVDYQYILEEHDITPGPRRQMFLAQLAHESDGFRTTREYASGRAYEGRTDLGNTEPGDGVRFRGRGLIQLTGRYNYEKFGDLLYEDLVDYPEDVEDFPLALEVSALYWSNRGLNRLADQGRFRTITRRINGGLNGISDREYYLRKTKSLGL